jgi:DDE superfamily endonuclease
MPAIVQIPDLVERLSLEFDEFFHCDPQRKHFREYLTGLMIASNKTVSGINSEFAETTDQSCLNRFLTTVNWNIEEINLRRLELMQRDEATRYHDDGVIAIDNVLIDHDGKLIEDVGYFWDHAEDRAKIAHDYVFADYVCQSDKHYPLNFYRFRKRSQCDWTGEEFQDHNELVRQLVDWVCEHEIPGDFTFDSFFTSAANLNYIHSKQDRFGRPRGYVADLKINRKIHYRGKEWRVDEFAASIDREARKAIRRGDERQWYFTCTIRIPNVNHKVRVLIIWQNRRDKTPRKVLVTNRVNWEVKRTLRCYRHRWTGTETFHRDGKQHLGMGDCQLRSGQGQTRHMYLVMLAYSLLMLEMKPSRAKKHETSTMSRLTTIGEACRALTNSALRATIEWALRKVIEKKEPVRHVIAQLGLT